ncbi:signal recognition particle 54 kDa subunit [Heterostelium album PN500]|uniref:Signal recognition particle 54 kDa protein n=1 Tax=Heterostelium pallidum (strain ATCC 26659 / Pp 5 / PN500) TaxID=670386 RepID=D3BBV3_HETP5|nr:signal recognition particle 54 kDa subunit [Heterostelium album PN500]EFA81136.1 signal recognition particle 54 kDa subunit [Heterostelium album PN500]|eukprot:XP_020433254.1 signal recognition particle 54 kDa subunit [Heterostelium album PN500]
MVLADLGNQISSALANMSNSTIINEETIDTLLKEVGNALSRADVSLKLIIQMRKNIKEQLKLDAMAAGLNKRRIIKKVVFDELIKLLDPGVAPWKPTKGKSNIIMFVGLQGAGKTTSVTKLASFYKRKGWATAMVCADTFRAGAFDQLKHNATKAKIPFYGSDTDRDPVAVAKKGVDIFKKDGAEIIIVDTSGRHKQEEELFKEMKEIETVVKPDNVIFVMDSSIGQAAFDQATAFKNSVSVGSVIITKMDGNSKGGGAISAVAATKSPIIFIGTGEHIPDLDLFDASSFVSKLLGMGDVKGMMNMIADVVPKDTKALEEIASGKFTFRNMKQQFLQILNLGPIDKFVQMMPGMSNIPQLQGDAGNLKLKAYINILDSMSDGELDGKHQITPQRILRIARGSGRHPREVAELVEQKKAFEKMFSKGPGLQNLANMAKGGVPNQRNLQQLASMVPPEMMKKMGMGGLQSMLASVKNMKGLGDLSKMDLSKLGGNPFGGNNPFGLD